MQATNDLEKWNCPTLTLSEIKIIKLSANPKINKPEQSKKALFRRGEKLFIIEIFIS